MRVGLFYECFGAKEPQAHDSSFSVCTLALHVTNHPCHGCQLPLSSAQLLRPLTCQDTPEAGAFSSLVRKTVAVLEHVEKFPVHYPTRQALPPPNTYSI